MIVLGLMTRPCALLIAITMGVASWTIHADVPFFAIHVARLYFWVFVCLTFAGAGRISLDHLIANSRIPRPFIMLIPLVLLGIGGYYQLIFEPPVAEPASVDIGDINTISVAGSFNDWDLSAQPMEDTGQGIWRTVVNFEESQPIEFKFAANEAWKLNCGALPDAKSGFPLKATGMIAVNANPANIKAYIPNPGQYEFIFNANDFSYSLDLAQPAEGPEEVDSPE